ncbi:efflux RND transporter periplasmic adaptor subunit [Pontibacillus yanchengensis]|uniref:Efflux RND transporter periplasmic adaptor subunit n=2 Tax=Pontibacillus yanchengensis TaxID=462910 RepID=A0ACC7VFJ0_9BACI|nr:efflux RND transporter periplasmic adaptor subunit [Pontibacillus yanchengensis]MYL53726.1 efflux RND transporter periplasmic adaptor subunit [Pontibacillus yanchengensis]
MKKLMYLMLLMSVFMISACSEDSTSEEPAEEQVTPVKVSQVAKGDLQIDKEVIGRAMPDTQSAVLPKTAGELTELTVEKGDKVEQGQIIGRVDAGNVQDNVRIQELAVQSAQKQLDGAINQKKAAEENLANARDQLQQARSAQNNKGNATSNVDLLQSLLGTAQDNASQMEELVESGAISQEQLAEVQKQVQQLTQQLSQARQSQSSGSPSVQSAINQAEAAVTQAEQQVDSAQIGVEQARLQVDQAQVQLEQARGQLQNTAIKANATGEIVSLNARVGDMVSNTQPMATIVNLNPITVEATVSASELSLFEKGTEVPVTISSLNADMKAKTTYISPVTNDTGLYPVEATITNSDETIKPGMMVTFKLPEITVEDSLLVPTASVIEEKDEAFVYVIKEERAIKTPVTIVRAQSNITAVKGDLTKGNQVVVKGQLTLTDDNKVRIMKEDD